MERGLTVLQRLFGEVLVILAEPVGELTGRGVPWVIDLVPQCAALGGLYTGLVTATHARIFVAGCDMPFLNQELIRYLAELAPEADVVMPTLKTGLEPLHAVYSKACVPHLEQMIQKRWLRVQDLIEVPGLSIKIVPEQDLRTIDPHLLSFFNVNTPADLEFAQKLLEGAGADQMRRLE
jgi:molybdopterin-guanine dinucleotide biosynthesis protein A